MLLACITLLHFPNIKSWQLLCSITLNALQLLVFLNLYLKLLLQQAIFSQKCIKYCLAAGLDPDMLGELTVPPRPSSCIKGSLLIGTDKRLTK